MEVKGTNDVGKVADGVDQGDEGLLSRTVNECETTQDEERHGSILCSQRWIVAYLGLLYGTILCIYRANMSIAIVCMVKTSDITNTSTSFGTDNTTFGNVSSVDETDVNGHVCREDAASADSGNRQGEFEWDKDIQSYILSAYFYGYLVSQIPGGWLSGRYGGKHVISIGMAIGSFLMLLTPVLARWNPYAVVVSRAFIGLFTGVTTPAWVALVGKWALPNERSRMLSMAWFGQSFGMVVGYASSGELCANGFDRGWGSIFYIHGAIGMLFLVGWLYFVSSSPQTHPRITNRELKLLEKHLKHGQTEKKEKQNIPWIKVSKTISVWAVVITHTFDNFMHYLIVTCLPLYLKEVLKFDIQSNGLYSSLPFLSMLVGLVTSGSIADYVMTKRILSRTTIRKILQCTGCLAECLFIILAGYTTCDKRELVIVFLCLCTFFQCVGTAAGYPCNFVDMAPSYGAVLFGISNCIATLPGMAAPVIVAKLTTNGTAEEWRMVFFIAAGLVLSAAIIYGLFSTSELVSWAEERQNLNKDITVTCDVDQDTVPAEMHMLNDGRKP